GGVRVELVDTAGVEGEFGMRNSECGTTNGPHPNPLPKGEKGEGENQSEFRLPNSASAGISSAAQQFAAEQRAEAHLRILCLDSTRTLNEWERERWAAAADDLIVLTKSDGQRAIDIAELPRAVAASARTGLG